MHTCTHVVPLLVHLCTGVSALLAELQLSRELAGEMCGQISKLGFRNSLPGCKARTLVNHQSIRKSGVPGAFRETLLSCHPASALPPCQLCADGTCLSIPAPKHFAAQFCFMG
eukprot:s83_g7.t1